MHNTNGSTQTVRALSGGAIMTCVLPGPSEWLGQGRLRWGSAELPLTPAYWAAQSWMWSLDEPEHFRLGRSLSEEILACILGGHGIRAEVGLAAYERLRPWLADPETLCDAQRVHQLLAQPFAMRGRPVHYRFARQKAEYVAAACRELSAIDDTLPDRLLRERLIQLRGFGPKTASWVVRNWRASDDVAILDIHILRACNLLGIFQSEWRVERHYGLLEQAYLTFSKRLGVKASILDSVMWMTMRDLPKARAAMGGDKPRIGLRPRGIAKRVQRTTSIDQAA